MDIFNETLNKTDDDKVKAGESGVIDVILKVMNTHISNVVLCVNGSAALCNITDGNGKFE